MRHTPLEQPRLAIIPNGTPLLDEEFDVDAYVMEPDQMLESQTPYHHITDHHHAIGEVDDQ